MPQILKKNTSVMFYLFIPKLTTSHFWGHRGPVGLFVSKFTTAQRVKRSIPCLANSVIQFKLFLSFIGSQSLLQVEKEVNIPKKALIQVEIESAKKKAGAAR